MKKIFKLTVFIIIFSVCFYSVNKVLVYSFETRWKVTSRSEQILSDEFENVDALIIGGSRMQVGVTPIILWEEAGILSYNIATNSQPPLMTRLILERYIDEVNPKLVIMDLPGIITEANPSDNSTSNQYILAFELLNSQEYKKEAINFLEQRYSTFDSRVFKFPFYKDHTRWKMLKEEDFLEFSDYGNFLLGAINEEDMRDDNLNTLNRPYVENYDVDYKFNNHAYDDYLYIINLMKEKGIEVVIVSPPYSTSILSKRSRAIVEFAKEHDLNLLDYNLTESFSRINFRDKKDFYDNSHMTIVGANKFTKVLAEDIKDLIELKEKTEEERIKLENYSKQYWEYYAEEAKKFE